MTKQTILRPLSRRWWRGPARLEGPLIVVDYARGDSYDPLTVPRLGFELTRVRTADDAVAFVTEFGLLSHGVDNVDVVPQLALPGREPAQNFVVAATTLREIVQTVCQVRKAVNGDAAAGAWLSANFVAKTPAGKKPRTAPADWYAIEKQIENPPDDRTVQIHASEWAGWQLSIGLQQTRAFVFDRAGRGEAIAPGHLRVGTMPRTLLDACYLTAALALAEREPVKVCPECERAFVVEDARQQYCQPACASAARFRRWQQQQRRRGKGSGHGKTARTRGR